jgi:hypothetical protein
MPSGIRMHERHRYYTDLLNTTSPVKIRYAQYIFNQHLTITDKKHLIQICDEAYCAMDESNDRVKLNFQISNELKNFIEMCGYCVEVYDGIYTEPSEGTVIELM